MRFNEARKIAEHLAKFKKEIEAMRTIMGVEAVNHYKKSFVNQGFTDKTFDKWKKRSKRENRRGKTPDGGVASVRAGRAILVKTGTLKRSINYIRSGRYAVVINTGALPYAKVHNDGFRGTQYVKGHHSSNKSINVSVRGSGSFVNGVFQKGRAKRVRLAGNRYQIQAHSKRVVMPKRQFIGYSQTLNNKILSKIDNKIKRIFA